MTIDDFPPLPSGVRIWSTELEEAMAKWNRRVLGHIHPGTLVSVDEAIKMCNNIITAFQAYVDELSQQKTDYITAARKKRDSDE